MSWYYVESGEQRGPVSEAELQGLFQAGTVTPETLVWREGMPNWLPYQSAGIQGDAAPGAAPAPSMVVCHECGQSFPGDQVIRIGNAQVCAACKPVYLQKVQEGAVVGGVLQYAGFWIRAVALIIDQIIVGVAAGILGAIIGAAMAAGGDAAVAVAEVLSIIVSFALGLAYVTWFLGRYGATPGKMVLGLRVVTPDGGRISYLRAFARYWAEILSGIICGIGYIMAAFDDEKRTLHDRICETRVIRT